MDLQRWIMSFAGGVIGMVNAAMAQDIPWHYNFEDMSETYQTDAGSEVSLSTRHYKLGSQSLKWTWQNDGRLLFTDPMQGRSEVLTGFRAWVYNEQALEDGALTFRFGTESELSANNPRYRFQFGLNFTGWRVMWIDLPEDAGNDAYMGPGSGRVTAFEIRAPNRGTVYLDLMELVREIDFRRSADAQVPFINPRREGTTREYRWNLNTLLGPLPSKITDKERRAFQTIVQRYETWILGNDVNDDKRGPVRMRRKALTTYMQGVHRQLGRYEIRREDDRIMGTPSVC